MFNNFFSYIKNEIFSILYRFLAGFIFMAMSFVFFTIFYEVNFLPQAFAEFFAYFWIEFIVGVLLLIFLIFGGFLYAYSDFSKNKISLILSNLLSGSFFYLLIVSLFIGWSTNFYQGFYFLSLNNYYVFTSYTFFLKIWIIFFSLITLLISKNFLTFSKYNLVEYPVLIGFTSFLLIILVSLIDLFAIFIVTESLFFLLMCLSAMKFSNITVEACIKYFIQNVFISGVALFGILMIYFICKSTNIFIIKGVLLYQLLVVFENKTYTLVFLVLGLLLFILTFLFKIGLFPLHFYVPDLYEASPYSIIFFFSAAVKPIFLLFFLKLFEFFILNFFYFFTFLFFISFFSVLVGLLGALHQYNIKRFLAFTSINQLGFLLFCFICNSGNWAAVLVYLLIYSTVQIPFFLIMSVISDSKNYNTLVNFSDFNNLFFSSNFRYIICFSFFLISGLPPFLLFVYKYILLTQVLLSGYFIVIVFMILMNTASLVYYLRIIKTILFEEKNTVSFISLKITNMYDEDTSNNDFKVLTSFSFYLLLIMFFSVYLFIYFDEIQSYIIDNSAGYLDLVYSQNIEQDVE